MSGEYLVKKMRFRTSHKRRLVFAVFGLHFSYQVRLLHQMETFQIGIVLWIFRTLASIFVLVGVTRRGGCVRAGKRGYCVGS